MEHIALANWFNLELNANPALISTALSAIQQAKSVISAQEIPLIGKEYSLFIDQQEVLVKANNLEIPDLQLQQLDEGFDYYDQESIALLGLEDFEAFLRSYVDFAA